MAGSDFLSIAASQIGRPYVWGGDSPQTGFDCSGLVYWAARQAGVPITGRDTYQMMATLPRTNSPGPGDLVFFNGGEHVGICTDVGCSHMLNSPNPSTVVQVDPVAGFGSIDGYWSIPGVGAQDGSVSSTSNPLATPVSDLGPNSPAGDLPKQFVQDIFGSKSAGELLIRGFEIFAGSMIIVSGSVFFIMALSKRRAGDGGGENTYQRVARQVRYAQRQAEIEAQHERGRQRRAGAVENAKKLEAQHEAGRRIRMNAEAKRMAKQAKVKPDSNIGGNEDVT
ncbi:MAG: C40 family peptidase [Nitrospira sp.]|nr:C40 family peptidase [Nitrospira sp.]